MGNVRTDTPGQWLQHGSVRLKPEDWEKLDRWADWIAERQGVYRSRGRAVEHLLNQIGEPPE